MTGEREVMMDEDIVREALYKKYIEPTKKERKKYIGIEIEMPIINLDGKPVDFGRIHEFTDSFISHFGFDKVSRDDEGNIYSAADNCTGDILSYDCSYNNLELSMGRAGNLNILNDRFKKYYGFIKKELGKAGYTLSGMGINPYRSYNLNEPIPNGRYRMLFHHLNSYKKYSDLPMYFHDYPNYGLFSSASQVQLDVDYDELPEVINTFSRLEPLKSVLFSNSVLLGENEGLLCARDMFWENSTHGINPHNIGMFECRLESVSELMSYIESTSMYCVERDGKYINFEPVNVMQYFDGRTIKGEYYDKGVYKEIEFQPSIEDIEYLRTFKFEDLTFRGTVEFRSVCCQPISDAMTVAAFHIGLKECLGELTKLLDEDRVLYHHGYTASELRRLMNLRDYPDFVDKDALYDLVGKVLDIACKGLKTRGYGEEKYLCPLYDRVRNRTNPARTMLDKLDGGADIKEIILEYA